MATSPKRTLHKSLSIPDIIMPIGIRAGFYEITPIIAEAILADRNPINRPVSATKVEQIVSDILADRYSVNGESIIFSDDGNLIDGQHRLNACAKAGYAIVSLVAFGIPAIKQQTVDQGRARTAGDIIGISGAKNANSLAAITRTVIAFQRNDGLTLGRPTDISTADIISFISEHPEIEIVNSWCCSFKNNLKGICSASEIGAARAILEPRYGPETLFYLERVALGDGLKQTDPAFAVRRRLASSGRSSRGVVLEALLRGAVAHMEGRQLSRIQIEGRFPALAKRP